MSPAMRRTWPAPWRSSPRTLRTSSSWTSSCAGGDLGIDVLRYVKQHHANIEVIVFSQLNWTAVRKTHMEAGAIAYFDKGLEFQQARDFIADLANARSAGASELEG